MRKLYFTFQQYCSYFIKNKGESSIHSPYLFDWYQKTIKASPSRFPENVRGKIHNLLKENKKIEVDDFKNNKRHTQRMADLLKTSVSSAKFSNFLNLLCEYEKIKIFLETGTSLGVNIYNIAQCPSIQKAISIEGNLALFEIAKNFTKENKKIHLVRGMIATQLPEAIQKFQPEIIFLDADHRCQALCEQLKIIHNFAERIKIIIIHDINWSLDMRKCWNHIILDKNYPLTVDIFQAGLIFTKFKGEKQHHILQF